MTLAHRHGAASRRRHEPAASDDLPTPPVVNHPRDVHSAPGRLPWVLSTAETATPAADPGVRRRGGGPATRAPGGERCAEAAARLRVNPNTLYGWARASGHGISAGLLPAEWDAIVGRMRGRR